MDAMDRVRAARAERPASTEAEKVSSARAASPPPRGGILPRPDQEPAAPPMDDLNALETQIQTLRIELAQMRVERDLARRNIRKWVMIATGLGLTIGTILGAHLPNI